MNKQALGRLMKGATAPIMASNVSYDAKIFDYGPTVPTAASVGYATGCIFLHTDGGAGTAVYINEGTAASCDFAAVSALTAAQEALLSATPGTVTASKAVIVDASKDAGDFRNLDAVNIDAGSSGVAGSVDVFPTSASKGKLAITCTDQTGDTTVALVAGAMAAARTITIPDPGAAASVLLTTGTATATTATTAEISQLSGTILADIATNAGAGITGGVGTICEHSVVKVGGLYKTEILLDLTGLTSTATDGDIIGLAAGGAAHIGQVTAARNGTIVAGRVSCLELAAGGDDDMAIYSATEATGAYDALIGSLTETLLLDHGAWTAGQVDALLTPPAANEYLYLVAKGGDTAAAYTGGKYLIELWGKA